MSCRTFIEFLSEYLAGELTEAERVEFEAHLAECSWCVAYLENYRQTIRLGKEALVQPTGPVPEEVPEELVQAILAARSKRE
jgi:anti-sigma factor RsiW